MSLYAVIGWWCLLAALAVLCWSLAQYRAEARADRDFDRHAESIPTDPKDPR